MSRTRKILDILDQLASSASLANDSANTSNNTSLLNTRKWLHDISVGRMPGGGPPRTTLRTPSRLYSIVTNIRDKPYWKRPTEMAAAAEKRREVSFEADTEPDDAEGASNKSTNNTELPKAHQPILKSYTGRNVAGSIKSNIFNTDIVDLEADISSTAETKKALESVKPPTEFGKNLQSGFLTKNRIFSFSKPVVRGPQAVVEKSFEKGDSSSDESSMDDEESDKEVEIVSTKATNSDTSTSSPENSKLQKPPSPVTKQQTPTLFTNTANSWECPSCMVNNNASDDKCPCCQTPKAGTASTTNNAAPASNAGPWDCSECWVSNKSTDDKCVACGTSKPGTTNNVATSNNAAPPQPVFKATEFKAVPTTVSFGFKPADTSAPKPDTTTNGTLNISTNLFNVKPSEPAVAPFGSTPASSFPVFGQQSTAVPNTEADSNSTSNIFSKPASTNPLSNNSAAPAPVSGFKFGGTTEHTSTNGTTNSNNLFGLPSAGTAATFSLTASKAGVNAQTTSSQALAPLNPQQSLFGASKPAATVPSFNFGGVVEKPATNGTFQFNGTNNSSSNLFNLPINGSSAAPASSSTLFGSAPAFSLGQQNSGLSKNEADNNSTSNTFSNSTSGTPFTFNATAPVSGFNFGGTTDQPSTNGTFQFGGSNSSSNLFNLPLTGAAQTFSAPAPSLPVLGQQNVFMPVSGGGGASSNNRKIILAKRQRKR